MTLRAVIFDMDFTLVDSSAAVIQCARAGFARAGLPVPADEAIVRAIGLPLSDLVAEHAGERAAEVVEGFLAEARRLTWVETTTLMPHARETLDALSRRGLALGIATSKIGNSTAAILRHHKLQAFFGAVVSADDVSAPKPDPAPLLACARLLDVAPSDAVYVGDHPYDIIAARGACMRVISVATGPTPRAELAALNPDCLIGALDELPVALDGDAS